MGYGGLARGIVDEALEYTGPHIIAGLQVELGQVQTGGDSSVWSSLDMNPGFQDTSNSLQSNFRLEKAQGASTDEVVSWDGLYFDEHVHP